MNFNQDLASCVVLTREDGTKLLPGCARRRNSASGLILPSTESAKELIGQLQENVSGLFGTLGFELIQDPFTLMRRAAQEGIGSFDSTAPGFLDHPLVFCTRASEIGDNLPTLLVEYEESECLNALARSGQRMMRSIDVIPWQRFDISDPLLGIWSANGEPFRNWDSGNQLVGLIVDGGIPVNRRCPLTGHWSSLEGTIPVFASEADYGYACRSGDLFRELSLFEPFDSNSYHVLHRIEKGSMQIQLISIDSLPQYLNDICKQIPALSCGQFSINPFCHRENGGYGWTANFLEKHETIEAIKNADNDPLELEANSDTRKRFGQLMSFNTVLGEWTIDSTNNVSLTLQADSWSGRATLHWSGGASIGFGNLSYSLAHLDHWGDLSDEEKKDALYSIFAEDVENTIFDQDQYASLDDQVNLFAAEIWDTYTGDKYVLRVSSPYEFISYLNKHLIEFDERVRIQGGRPCGSPATGSTGSGDVERERLLTKQSQAALFGIAESMAVSGYKPEKSLRVCSIVNRLFETLHVNYAGYVQDLLVQCELDEDLDSLCDSLDIGRDEVRQFKDGIELRPPLEGLRMLKQIIGGDCVALLSPKAVYFAANGLFDMSLKGDSPHLDYATVSIEFVKALEVELGFLFRSWLASFPFELVEFGSSRHESDAQNYIRSASTKKAGDTPARMFSLGSMGYLLGDVAKFIKKPDTNIGPLSLLAVMAATANKNEAMKPLLQKSFYSKFINKVSHSFRNGGAHDQKIPLITCMECRDSILGSSANPGWLITVSQALVSLNESMTGELA